MSGWLIFSIAGIAAILLIIVLTAGNVFLAFPDTGEAPKIIVNQNSANVARGAYLANPVCVCIDGHSPRDWALFSGPILPGKEGMGGEAFDERMGMPGSFTPKNITPYHLHTWTDGEIYHVITTGVNKDGVAHFPIMPYLNYGKMDPEYVRDIIAYLRNLPSIENDVPPSKANFPFALILRTLPQPASRQERPAPDDSISYGSYLLNAGGCGDCHSPTVNNEPDIERFLAGGQEFPLPTGGTLRSSNITPQEDSGLGAWSREDFVRRFKAYADIDTTLFKVESGGFTSLMPWSMYAGMTEKDLSAIYAYLRTVKPVNQAVEPFTP